MHAEINSDIARDAKELFAAHQCSIKSEFSANFCFKVGSYGKFRNRKILCLSKSFIKCSSVITSDCSLPLVGRG